MDSWIISRQEINGRRNSEDEERRNYQKDNINIDLSENDLHASYRFSVLMMKKIVHGEVNGIRDIISEYTKLFLRLASVTDNNRILKDKCIVISTIACHFAIQSNVSYERMINMLWRSIVELEKLKTSNDIISQMETTIERFAQAVSTLSEKGYSLHINRCFNYIKSHLSENITLKKLADHVQLSPVYLSSLIKKETNQSLSYYINLFRIEESKRLLIYTNKSMQEIACDLGYSYQTHFNTVFKKYERQTPLEYRKKTGDKNYEDIY